MPEKKHKAVIPIPDEAMSKLEPHLKSGYYKKNYGDPIDGTKYIDEKGQFWMFVARFMKDGNKADVPQMYCDDGKWHAGNPKDKNRPLLGIDKLSDKPVLITEGEKTFKVKLKGYDNISWSGGTGQIKKSNWKALKDHKEIIIWPDYDKQIDKKTGKLFPDIEQPGLKAALYIKSQLPQAKILNTYRDNTRKSGWDIADCEDPLKFIKETEEYIYIPPEEKKTEIKPGYVPFKFLGFDDGRHYFIPKGSNIVKKINFGQFTKARLLELAPLSYWEMEFHQKKGFDVDSAIDYIIRESESKGFFMPDNVRGAGVWFDENRIIVNNGHGLQDCNNHSINMDHSKYHYVMSDKKMGDLSGEVSTVDQGTKLIDLFITQGFETDLEAISVLGWSLIAPFGGILKWRPHLWITGPIQTGKSYLLENLIHPLTGPFSFVGSGKDSAAGLYRALWKDPCPVLKDEMEPGRDKDNKKRIDEVLDTARNASSNFSAYKTISNQHGGVDRFCIRSMFCFSSVVPYFTGDAIESRVLICRLKSLVRAREKKRKTIEMLRTGFFDDPGIFIRKIFKNLQTIIINIEIIKNVIKDILNDDRKSDNYAPLFAAYFSLITDEIMKPAKIGNYMQKIFFDLEHYTDGSDEDKLLKQIFDEHLRIDPSKTLSIGEILLNNNNELDYNHEEIATLARNGIKIHKSKYLAIARNHTHIKKILQDTIYSGRYEEVLKRHDFAENTTPAVRFAGVNSRAILLDWERVKKKYFEDEETEESGDLFNPF
jgi:putative DNA primase/helicase